MNTASDRAAARESARNVDPREAAHYASLAETWWDPSGPFWPLHRLNAFRSDYLNSRLSALFGRDASTREPLDGLEVLDVGCGGGILSESIARLGGRVHGIDVVERNIAIAQHHATGSGLPVRYELTEAESLADTGARYDVVLNMEVVEHVPDPASLLAACSRMVRPGGALVVATINRTLRAWLFAIVGAEYVLRWLPRGTHRWSMFVTPEEVERAMAGAGLSMVDRTGVRVNPVTRGFSLTPSLAVNYMLVARRAPGA